METDLQTQLDAFYRWQKIHPLDFDCPDKAFCQQFSTGAMIEAKMSMVGSAYGQKYPKIAVISLDPPNDGKGTFKSPAFRTTEYVSKFHEEENYRDHRPNVHWAMTQIIVNEILVMFGHISQADAASVSESYSRLEIENVSAFFTHVNIAKCCMNNIGKAQADWQVHEKCANAHLREELELLAPEIIVSQGKDANKVVGQLFDFPGTENKLPASQQIPIQGIQILWLPMYNPARHLKEIRLQWPFYAEAIQNWKSENYEHESGKLKRRKANLDLIKQIPSLETQLPAPNQEISENGKTPTDYGLYKCENCGKMVMGFEKEDHTRGHGGKSVEWKKVR